VPSAVVTVWFDYACPHSYIGMRRLEELASTLDLEIDRRPFLVRSESSNENQIRYGRIQRDRKNVGFSEVRRQPLYQPGESIGIEPASNRSLSTLPVHAATACAKERGLDGPFFQASSKEYWERGVHLGSLYTLRRITISVGLDWKEMWPKLESGRYHDLVLAQHDEAKMAGVVQTPTFRIGGDQCDGPLYSGAMSAEELRAAVAAVI